MIKSLLTASLGGIGMLLAGSLDPASAQQAAPVTITVGSYGGAYNALQTKYAISLFTARTGIKVEFVDGNADDHLAKLIASKGREPPMDVVFLDDSVQFKAIAAGVLAKIGDFDVPNLKLLEADALQAQGYGPAVNYFSCGIVYNAAKFKEAGIPAPTAWADLWNPALAGHVAVANLQTTPGQCFLIAATNLAGGDENTPEKGIAKIAEIKAQSYPGSSSVMTALMSSGDAWAGPMLNGRAWSLIDKSPSTYGYVLPKEGAIRGMTMIDIVAGTKHPKEAAAYVNEILGPLFQLGSVYEWPYGPSNKLLQPILAAYPDVAKKFPATIEDLHRLREVNWDAFNKSFSKAVNLWNRQVTK